MYYEKLRYDRYLSTINKDWVSVLLAQYSDSTSLFAERACYFLLNYISITGPLSIHSLSVLCDFYQLVELSKKNNQILDLLLTYPGCDYDYSNKAWPDVGQHSIKAFEHFAYSINIIMAEIHREFALSEVLGQSWHEFKLKLQD